jgi:hypothetical protein
MGGWMVKLNVGDGAASPSTRMSLSILEKPAAIK